MRILSDYGRDLPPAVVERTTDDDVAGPASPAAELPPETLTLAPPPEVPNVDFGASPAPVARLDQRREETLRAFADLLRAASGRVLLAAESAGRRELLLELLRPYAIDAKVVTSWQEFLRSDARVVVAVAPIASGVALRL